MHCCIGLVYCLRVLRNSIHWLIIVSVFCVDVSSIYECCFVGVWNVAVEYFVGGVVLTNCVRVGGWSLVVQDSLAK